MFRYFRKKSKHSSLAKEPKGAILHLDPLTPSGSIEGWAYVPTMQTLKGSRLSFESINLSRKISGTIDIYRADVGDFKRTDGFNGFNIARPANEELRLLLDPALAARIDANKLKIVYTDFNLMSTQIRQRLGEKIPISQLLQEFTQAKSTPLYWHYLLTNELKRESSPDDLLALVYSSNASQISSHRTRTEEIKLLLQYEMHEDAAKVYNLALDQATSRNEVEALKLFKATYLGQYPEDFIANKPESEDDADQDEASLFKPIADLKQAVSRTLDFTWFAENQKTNFASKEAAINYYLKQALTGVHAPVNATFDPNSYAAKNQLSASEALTDLLCDESLSKRPFDEFDPKFVHEYYCKPINYRLHPYLYYLENPSILINPKQYFKSSSNGRVDNDPEYWNLSRANSHFSNIFSPLNLSISTDTAKAIHVLVPAFDPKTISAGFFGVFSTAKLLARIQTEYQVKLLFTDTFEFYPSLFEYTLSKTTGMEDLLDIVSYQFLQGSDQEKAVFNPGDRFVATVWYTAKIAQNIRKALGNDLDFLYLIQDYEAGFYPRNSHYTLAASTYNAKYFALVSSETLFNQLKSENLIDPAKSVFFNNACAAKSVSRESFYAAHAAKTRKRLLFYGRPEVDRNMFELTILTLMLAYKDGVIDNSWDVYSIGLGSQTIIELNNFTDSHAFVNSVPRMTLQEYEDFILSTDVCLTLMASPHPSLLPFDFSGIGSLVVTNSFQTKNQSYFDNVSDLIICKEPDPIELVQGLKEAVARSSNLEWRYDHSHIRYPRQWDDTWTPQVIAKLQQWCHSASS
jgi:hypothetical protein